MKFSKIFIGILAMMVCLAISFSSCKKDVSQQNSEYSQYNIGTSDTIPEIVLQLLKEMETDTKSPQFLKSTTYNSEIVCDPGTEYIFMITNYPSSQPPQIKFFAPDHQEYYHSMNRIGVTNDWYLTKELIMGGHYVWRYVDSNHNNLTNWNTYIDNTYIRFNEYGTSSLAWPFGYEDGSDYDNQGLWYIAAGPGGVYSHNNNSYYSYDWNWSTTPTADNGKILTSPIDGIVVNISKYYVDNDDIPVNNRWGWQIIIEQEYGNKKYRHAFCHIQQSTIVNLYQYVSIGTPVAYLGSTGATSPHAHCQLNVVGTTANIPMEYNADFQ